MRHGKRRGSFGRKMSHRKATVKHLATALLKFQRISTTIRKAKEARRLAEKLITLGKRDDLAARRRAFSLLTNRDVVEKLFKEIAPLFKNRQSGFTRVIPFGFRRGDGAPMAILELTEKKAVEKAPKKQRAPKKEKAPEEEPLAERGPTGAEPEKKPKEAPKKQEAPRLKVVPKSKPTLEEEKAREKAKTEEKRIDEKRGSFLKNLRGRFRRRGTDS
jgi:large subunit ribosomal protein L17